MRLIFLGPPGSGKGTQAKLLSDSLQLLHISTGDILREAVARGTPLGKQAESFMKAGQFVPDTLVNDLIYERFRRDDRPERFIMDGYPRTLSQAASFDALLRQQFLDLTAVIQLLVDDEEIVRRLAGRWTCPRCKTTYHLSDKPPHRPGVCDKCGVPLAQRDDDKEETVRRRLGLYHQSLTELVPFYQDRGLLHEVEGKGSVEQIYQNIRKALP